MTKNDWQKTLEEADVIIERLILVLAMANVANFCLYMQMERSLEKLARILKTKDHEGD